MAQVVIDATHHCDDDAQVAGSTIGVHRAARSSCHGAILAEGGTPETGFTCTECNEPCEKVVGPRTAHWICHPCGTRRSQVIAEPVDEVA